MSNQRPENVKRIQFNFFFFTCLVNGYELGKIIIEGKTKQVHDLPKNPGLCLLLSKDRITAGDGVKAHDMQGKAEISNRTNEQVFHILNEAGKHTLHFRTKRTLTFVFTLYMYVHMYVLVCMYLS